jgi:hypothetical protein
MKKVLIFLFVAGVQVNIQMLQRYSSNIQLSHDFVKS